MLVPDADRTCANRAAVRSRNRIYDGKTKPRALGAATIASSLETQERLVRLLRIQSWFAKAVGLAICRSTDLASPWLLPDDRAWRYVAFSGRAVRRGEK